MKPSFYNLYIPRREKSEYILYNTLSGAVFRVDREGVKAIQDVMRTKLDPRLVHDLRRNRIWIDDEVDERAVFKVLQERHKYRAVRAYFCLYMTYDCNLACSYCYLDYLIEGGKPSRYLDGETLNSAIEFTRNSVEDNNCKELIAVFTGGEPILNISRVLKTLDILDRWTNETGLGFKSIIFSNGTLFTREMVRKLLKYDIFVQITLAGSREIHDRKRPRKDDSGSYESIVRTLRMLRELGLDFGIRADIDKENFHSIDHMLDDLKERVGEGLYIRFFPIMPAGQAPPDSWVSLCPRDRELASFSQLWNLAREKGFKVVISPLRRYVYCPYHTNCSHIIDPFGDVYKCEAGVKERSIGRLGKEGKLLETYRHYDWMSRDPLSVEECRNCKYLPACGGGCAAIARGRYRTWHSGECHEKYLIRERVRFLLGNVRTWEVTNTC